MSSVMRDDLTSRSNRRYVWRLWIIPLVILLYVLAMTYTMEGAAKWKLVGAFAGLMLLFFVFRWWVRRRAIRAVERMLQQPDPDVLLAYYDRNIKTGGLSGLVAPDMELIKNYSKAIVLALYGQHQRSLDMVAGHDLSNKPPVIQAMGLQSRVINDMLQHRNLEDALRIARECVRLGTLPQATPGARVALEANSTWVDVGEVLTGNRDGTLLARMEERFLKTSPMLRPIIAWGLCLAYKGDNPARHDELLAWLKEKVPYCTPLLNTSEPS